MESKKRTKFNPASEITGKQMYEIAEESRKEYTEEPIEGFGLRELDYIMELDIQEYSRVRKEIDRLVRLTEDICLHYKEVKDCYDLTLERMECHEASKHFEDYMNKPITSTKYVRDEIKKNHFSSMFGKMLTPESGTRQTHALPYVDTDSVIDGTDKTLCMYDYAKEIVEMSDDMIDYCKRVHNGKDEAECAMCTEVLCSQSGVNNK